MLVVVYFVSNNGLKIQHQKCLHYGTKCLQYNIIKTFFIKEQQQTIVECITELTFEKVV